jgi:hypothetical protein
MSDRCTIDAQISEVEYELAQRRVVYPRLAAKSGYRRGELDLHESRMRAVLGTLRWLKDHREQIKEFAIRAEAPIELG